MKKIFTIVAVLFSSVSLVSQVPFHRYVSVPGSGGLLYSCLQVSDGGYVAAGKVTDYTSFDDDCLIMKTDASGNSAWIKRLSSSESEEFTGITELADGSFIAVGSAFSMITFTSQAIVVKFSSSGSKVWAKYFNTGGTGSARAKRVTKDSSGNLYVFGAAEGSSSQDYFIMKLDGSGNILSQTTFGTAETDFPLCFLRSSTGDFYIGGWNNNGTGENIHLIKINSGLTVAWNRLISGTTKYFAYDIAELGDGKVVLAGRYDEGNPSYDILLAAFEPATGNPAWAKSYSSAENGLYAYGVTVQAGDKIVITGKMEVTEKGTVVASMAADGSLSWAHRSGETGNTGYGYGITTTTTGQFAVCGPLTGESGGIVQLMLLPASGEAPCHRESLPLDVTDRVLPGQSLTVSSTTGNLSVNDLSLTESALLTLSDGCLGTGLGDQEYPGGMTISPNPASAEFTIRTNGSGPVLSVEISTLSGLQVFELRDMVEPGNGELTLSPRLAPGMYVVKVTGPKGTGLGKLVVRN